MLALIVALFVAAGTTPVAGDTVLPVVVSPRVGFEIGQVEQKRFHLFPGVEGLSSAVFYRAPDSSYSVSIQTTYAHPARSLSVSADQFVRIGRYIDNFEQVVPELAALPEGRQMYFDLWQGLGRELDSSESALHAAAPESRWAGRVVDGLSGAACGLGIGGAVGAISATEFVSTRHDSVLKYGCLGGEDYWYHYSVDIYDLNRGTYAAVASPGLAAGAGAGYLLGRAHDRRSLAVAKARRGIADYDFFGDPITELEVRKRMVASNRIGWTILGTLSGWIVGTGAGLIATSITRGIMFKPNKWDTIIVRNDGFSLDIPLIALSLGGAVRGAWLGYRRGNQADWRNAVALLKQERLKVYP